MKKEKCNLQILVSLFALLRLVVSKPPSFLLSFSSPRALTSHAFPLLRHRAHKLVLTVKAGFGSQSISKFKNNKQTIIKCFFRDLII